MQIEVIEARMARQEEGFVGSVVFAAVGHAQPYEIHLHSKDARAWDFSLTFAHAPGKEEEMEQIEAVLDNEDDETFDRLIEAGMASLSPS